MATIDFPASPAVGQEYPFGDFIYVWDGVKWTTKVIVGSTEESDSRYVNTIGDEMTGDLTVPKVLLSSAQSTEVNSLTRKDYVDDNFLNKVTTTRQVVEPEVQFTSTNLSSTDLAMAHFMGDGSVPIGTQINIRSMREHPGGAWIWEKVASGSLYYCIGTSGTLNKIRLDCVNGEIYVGSTATSRVYHEGFKPTVADVGAVPREEFDSIVSALMNRIEALESRLPPALVI